MAMLSFSAGLLLPFFHIILIGVVMWCVTTDVGLQRDRRTGGCFGRLVQTVGMDGSKAPALSCPARPGPGIKHVAPAAAPKTLWAPSWNTETAHAPGVWVIYFSLAACAFGMAKRFIPAGKWTLGVAFSCLRLHPQRWAC